MEGHVSDKQAQTPPDADGTNSRQKPQRRKTRKRVTRKVLKTIAVAGAWDVLAKDARRIRPLHPSIWKDVFSAKGLQALKYRLTKIKAVDPGTEINHRWVIRKTIIPALTTSLIGAGVACYGLLYGLGIADMTHTPVFNKIAILIAIAFGLLVGLINLLIALVATAKIISAPKIR